MKSAEPLPAAPKTGWSSSVRFRLVLLVLVSVVPAILLVIYSASEQRRFAALDAEREALRVARLGSVTQQRLIEGTRNILIAVSQLPEANGLDSQRCSRLLKTLMGQYTTGTVTGKEDRIYSTFGIVELDGSVFASAIPMKPDVNLADRSYFVRALENRGFAIGDYQIGRLTGQATVNFAYPIMDAEGNPRRVAYAALNLAWVNHLAEQAQMPPNSSLTVLDRNGTVLARYPDPEKWLGKTLAGEPATQTMLSSRSEGTLEARGLDGVDRLYAYTPLLEGNGAGFVCLSVSIPKKVAFAAADEMQRRNMLLLGGVGLLAIGLAWFGGNAFIVQWISALILTTRKLASGDLSARVGATRGPREINHLARAFDDMAAALDQRTAERVRAEAALKALNEDLEKRVAERTRELQFKNEQMEDDLKMASELQEAILPQQYPTFPSGAPPDQSALRFCHRYFPTGAVGGDFFNVRALSQTSAGIFLCDVMGHGVRSALVTAMARALVEELGAVAHDPGMMLTEVNAGLCGILQQMRSPLFATGIYLTIDTTTLMLNYAKAGHPDPLLIHPSKGIFEPLTAPQGGKPALGLLKGSSYATHSRQLEPGDWIMIYTDGLYEIETADGSEYDEKRLRAAVQARSHLTPGAALDSLLEEIRSLAGPDGILDDLCVVAVEVADFPLKTTPAPAAHSELSHAG